MEDPGPPQPARIERFLIQANNFVMGEGNVRIHVQKEIRTPEELAAYESKITDLGYEGLIIRDPFAPYKFGRSTVREGFLLKVKRFVDSEAVVIGIEEEMYNGNEAQTNASIKTTPSPRRKPGVFQQATSIIARTLITLRYEVVL